MTAAKPISPQPEDLVSTAEAAEILDKSEVTLVGWRSRGVGPRYYQEFGKRSRVYYSRADLIAWRTRNLVIPSVEKNAKEAARGRR